MGLQAGFLEFSQHELVRFLLRETGQYNENAVNPADLLTYLKLTPVILDLEEALGEPAMRPRGLLSFEDRIIGVHDGLKREQARFTTLHETAHYILPTHQDQLYVCDERDLRPDAMAYFEQEANAVAAALLFKGDLFTLEANTHPVSAKTLKLLKDKFVASFEATARRMVAKHFKPYMLVVFAPKPDVSLIDPQRQTRWLVKYCVPSPAFASRYTSQVEGELSGDLAEALAAPGREITDSITRELPLTGPSGTTFQMTAEFFCNHYNVFAFLQPSCA
jgi:Zn-dependent peptidase ImmA (M78 family)